MSKVNYRKCDICGEILKTDIRVFGFTNGYRIWNRLFNKLDIWDTCMEKIKQLSIDSKEEEKYVKELFDKRNKYEDFNLESIYFATSLTFSIYTLLPNCVKIKFLYVYSLLSSTNR